MNTPQSNTYTIQITNFRRKRSWGWAFSNQPTGEGTTIETPTRPMHTGTLGQLSTAIANDTAYEPTSGTFYTTAWFWRKRRITHTWAWMLLEGPTDLLFDPSAEDYATWSRRNREHHATRDTHGWGWLPGFHPPDDHHDIKIRVA